MNPGAIDLVERIGRDGRFELVRRLGEGGFGTVFEAIDRRYDCRVALKLLRRDHAAAIMRFKQEFRSLADVIHPNLVRLYELVADGEIWFFTMELIEGTSFAAYVTGDPDAVTITAELAPPAPAASGPATGRAIDDHRMRAAMLQLAESVHALHAARKLHCDIKPSNVLVTAYGRVVLLDFGLVTDLDTPARRGFMGTPGYIAPEQARGGQATPASDWYSVGVMLHELLTGQRPGAVSDKPPHAPGELWSLCEELLSEDPAGRPTGDDVVHRLRGTTSLGAGDERGSDRELGFVGRRAELARLDEAWRSVVAGDGPALVRVIGASGAGKTELVRHFLGRLRLADPGALVLANRCYEQESVPYKAIDGAIDALGEHVAATDPGELASLQIRRGTPLSYVFPALTLAPATDDGPVAEPAPQQPDVQAQRRRAFQALRALFERLGRSQPIALFLDDLQWGDVDSARLLIELLRPPHPPRVLVIASYRPEAAGHGFLAALDEAQLELAEHAITVGELDAADARALARLALGTADDERAAMIAHEAAGSPIFIKQIARQAAGARAPAGGSAPSLHEMIVDRLGGLDDDARRLIETIAIAGRPIPEQVATRAAALDGTPARLATMAARHARFVTTRAVANTMMVETAHDRVRDAITQALAPEALRGIHLRLAETLLDTPQPDPEPLVHHLLAAGDDARARSHALVAVERAERVFAFERAAHYYALILRLTRDDDDARPGLLARHAEALANAGRSGDAAEAFQAAADALTRRAPDDPAVLLHSRRAAELSLRSGRLDIGAQRMAAVLQRVGVTMPASRRRAGALAIARRLRLFARGLGFPARASLPPGAGDRLDALWSASSGVSMVNYVLADALGLQHLLEALRFGARTHLVRGLGYEAAFEALIGGKFLHRRCRRILDQMDQLAAESEDPYDHAWARMARGITSWFDGDWVATWRECDAAAAVYRERCRGVAWELAICDAYRLPSLAYLGDLRLLAQLVPRAYEAARERGDLFGATTLQFGIHCLITLAADRPDETIERAAAAVAVFPTEIYLMPHYHHLLAYVQAEIYRGNPERAWQRIEHEWRGLQQSQLLRVQFLRVEIRHLRARAALAAAVAAPASEARRRKALVRAALQEARVIARDDIAPAGPLASAIRAAAVRTEGDRDQAAALLQAAITGFEAAHMALYAQAARAALGTLQSGDAGRLARDAAARWMAEQGVTDVTRMTAMLLPGL